MKRRRSSDAPKTPAETVELWNRARSDARELHLDPEQAREYVSAVLAERGIDVVDAIRARRALRRLV